MADLRIESGRMTKADFVDKYKHELAGMVLDAAVAGRAGKELSLFVRQIQLKVHDLLSAMHNDLTEELKESKARKGTA